MEWDDCLFLLLFCCKMRVPKKIEVTMQLRTNERNIVFKFRFLFNILSRNCEFKSKIKSNKYNNGTEELINERKREKDSKIKWFFSL